jgi:hypothetical protein
MRKQLSLVVLLLLTTATAQKSKEQWKEYTYPQDRFAITAPSEPFLHPDRQNSEVRVYSVHLEGRISLAIRVADWKIDCEAKRQQLKANAPQGQPEKDILLGGVAGLESTGKSIEVLDVIVTERFFCLKDKVFVLSMGYPAKQPLPAAATRLLDSFRFL